MVRIFGMLLQKMLYLNFYTVSRDLQLKLKVVKNIWTGSAGTV